jgi:hypothetical protein
MNKNSGGTRSEKVFQKQMKCFWPSLYEASLRVLPKFRDSRNFFQPQRVLLVCAQVLFVVAEQFSQPDVGFMFQHASYILASTTPFLDFSGCRISVRNGQHASQDRRSALTTFFPLLNLVQIYSFFSHLTASVSTFPQAFGGSRSDPSNCLRSDLASCFPFFFRKPEGS